jgi:DNA-binding response OmpR family regulator
MKILLLEDEYSLRISIKEFLQDLEYEVDDYADGNDAHDAIFSKSYDLLLLDVNVPGMNGFELLKAIRKEKNETPAIFLTSMVDVDSLKEGYEKGCCDYIRKPFDLIELELRISQAYKSFYLDDENILELRNNLSYDMKIGKLTLNGEEIILRKIEKDMLAVLIKHKNTLVSMEVFQDEIWGEYVEPATVRVQINNLKQKLPADIIKNRRGLGYIIER